MKNPPSVYRKSLEDLFQFVETHLPEEHRSQYYQLASQFFSTSSSEQVETLASFLQAEERCKRLHQKYDALLGIVSDLSDTCIENGFEAARPHFRAFKRMVIEFDVPIPSIEEIREDILKKTDQRIAQAQAASHVCCSGEN